MRQVPACAAGLLVTLSAGAGTAAVGPVTEQPPYLKGLASEVEFTAILSAGDAVKRKNKGKLDYVMVGLPDGLGAYDNGDGTFTLLMNHELRPDRGVARAPGFAGAFVSRWQIRKSDLRVLAGSDQIEVLKVWDPATQAFVPADATTGALNRLCSADLAAPSAFFDQACAAQTTGLRQLVGTPEKFSLHAHRNDFCSLSSLGPASLPPHSAPRRPFSRGQMMKGMRKTGDFP